MRPYAALYLRPAGTEVLDLDLAGLHPVLIQGGGHEVLRPDWERLHQRLQRAGGQATLSIWPGMWHTFQCFAPWVPEAQREVAVFLRSQLAGQAVG